MDNVFTPLPSIEICILTYNRPNQLQALLTKLSCIDATLSIHIAENPYRSRHKSEQVIEKFSYMKNLRYTQNTDNIGAFGSYCYLLDSCSKDFIWILPDDYLPSFEIDDLRNILIGNLDKFCIIPKFCLNDVSYSSESHFLSYESWFINWVNSGSMGHPFYSLYNTKKLISSTYLQLLTKNLDMLFFNEGEFVNTVLLMEDIGIASGISVFCSGTSYSSQLSPRQLLYDGIRFFGDLLILWQSVDNPRFVSKDTYLTYKKETITKYTSWFRQLSCVEASMPEIRSFMQSKISRHLIHYLWKSR